MRIAVKSYLYAQVDLPFLPTRIGRIGLGPHITIRGMTGSSSPAKRIGKEVGSTYIPARAGKNQKIPIRVGRSIQRTFEGRIEIFPPPPPPPPTRRKGRKA